MQYRASGAAAWGAAPPSHAAAAAAAAAAYPPYTRYPSAAAAAAAGQMPVGAQQLPPTANPYATATYAQHASVSPPLLFIPVQLELYIGLETCHFPIISRFHFVHGIIFSTNH